jgi:hypothetical protein
MHLDFKVALLVGFLECGKGLIATEAILEQALAAEVYNTNALHTVNNFSELLGKLHSKFQIQPPHKKGIFFREQEGEIMKGNRLVIGT